MFHSCDSSAMPDKRRYVSTSSTCDNIEDPPPYYLVIFASLIKKFVITKVVDYEDGKKKQIRFANGCIMNFTPEQGKRWKRYVIEHVCHNIMQELIHDHRKDTLRLRVYLNNTRGIIVSRFCFPHDNECKEESQTELDVIDFFNTWKTEGEDSVAYYNELFHIK